MSFERQVLHLVRATIEADAPVSIGSGDLIAESDVALVRDASGLPVVPGSSLQGTLWHLWHDAYGEEPRELLGYAGPADEGKAGRVVFGFGLPHDAGNQAVSRRLTRQEMRPDQDAVLALLASTAPVLRHHVKLDHRSVADDRHKFSRSAAPVGTRFSFELAMWGKAEDSQRDKSELSRLVGLIVHPAFRLGGAGRRGYGKVKLVKATYACSDEPKAIRDLRRQPPSTALPASLDPVASSDAVLKASVRLAPIGPWRVSWHTEGAQERARRAMTLNTNGIRFNDPRRSYDVGHGTSGPDARAAGRDQDGPGAVDRNKESHPVREPRIVWNGDRASLEDPSAQGPFRFAVPGSAIRGPLTHRALFHWNASRGHFADAPNPPDPKALERWHVLFGTAKERSDEATGKRGRAAALFVADGTVSGVTAVQALYHNSIDRFTGGVPSGVLYVEEVAIGGEITIDLLVAKPAAIDQDVRTALLKALLDLTSGRLAFGARSHGFTTGAVSWSDPNGTWAQQWMGMRGACGDP